LTGRGAVTLNTKKKYIDDYIVVDVVNDGSSPSVAITLAALGWEGSTAPFTQAITVTGLEATELPLISLQMPDGSSTSMDTYAFEFDKVSQCEVTANTLTFQCDEVKPTIDLLLIVKRG